MSLQKIDIHLHEGETSVKIDGAEVKNLKALKVESLDPDLEHFDVTFVLGIASHNVDISLEQKNYASLE